MADNWLTDTMRSVQEFKRKRFEAQVDGEAPPPAQPASAAAAGGGMSQSQFGGPKKTKEQIALDAKKFADFMRARGE